MSKDTDNSDKIVAEPAVKHISEVMENKDTPADADRPVDPREEIARKFAKEQRGYEAPVDSDEEDEDDPVEDEEENSDPKEEKQSTDNESSDDDSDDSDESDESEEDEEEESSKEEMVVVKINGKTREVEKSKVDAVGGVANYQKIVAADEQFREAAESRKILEEHAEFLQHKERELAEKEKSLSNPGRDSSTTDELPLSGVQSKEALKQARLYREALFNGDEDAADEHLAKLVEANRADSTGKNEEDVIKEATDRALQVINEQREQEELKRAVSMFNEEYADVVSDPRLWKMADEETVVLKREHPNWTAEQILTEAGERIRSWRGTPKEEEASSMSEKRAEKQRLSNVKASSVRKPAPQTAPKTVSSSDYVQRLKRQRGQA